MKKVCAILTLGLAVSACASSPGYPTKLADGATSGIWTSVSANDLQACLDRTMAGANAVAVQVASNDMSKTAYATTISLTGPGQDINPVSEKILTTCIAPVTDAKPVVAR